MNDENKMADVSNPHERSSTSNLDKQDLSRGFLTAVLGDRPYRIHAAKQYIGTCAAYYLVSFAVVQDFQTAAYIAVPAAAATIGGSLLLRPAPDK